MEIVINHKLRVIEFWLKRDEEIRDEEIKAIQERHFISRYKAVIYRSGNARLTEMTQKLILHNLTLN